MTLLSNEQFIELYEYVNKLVNRSGCTHTLRRTRAFMQKLYADYAYIPRSEIIRTNIEKIVDLGGHCDCEVLMNVTPDEWELQRDNELVYPTIVGSAASGAFVSRMMFQAVQHSFTWDEGDRHEA